MDRQALIERLVAAMKREVISDATIARVLAEAFGVGPDEASAWAEGRALGPLTDDEIDALNAALDAAPSDLGPFEQLVTRLSAAADWKQLERNYRKMLHRTVMADTTKELQFRLWAELGAIYADRLERPDSAGEAWRMALTTMPDEALRRRLDALG